MRISGKAENAGASEHFVLPGHVDLGDDFAPTRATKCLVINANTNDFKWSFVPMDVVVVSIGTTGEPRHEMHAAYSSTINCKGTQTHMSWSDRFGHALRCAEQRDPSTHITIIWIEAPSSMEWNASLAYAKTQMDAIEALRAAQCFIAIERDDMPRIVPVHPTVSDGYGACMFSDRGQFDLGDIRKDSRKDRLGSLWMVSPLFPQQNRAGMVDEWFQYLWGRAAKVSTSDVTIDVEIPSSLSYSPNLKSLIGITAGTGMDFSVSNSTQTVRITVPAGSTYEILATFAHNGEDMACPLAHDSTLTPEVASAVIDCASKDARTAGAAAFSLYGQIAVGMSRGVTALVNHAMDLAHVNHRVYVPPCPRLADGALMRNVSGI